MKRGEYLKKGGAAAGDPAGGERRWREGTATARHGSGLGGFGWNLMVLA